MTQYSQSEESSPYGIEPVRRIRCADPTRLETEAAMPEFRTHELLLPAELAGLRLDQALARALPQYSRARLQSWIDRGAVRIAGRVPRARDKVWGGERVRIEARLEPEG